MDPSELYYPLTFFVLESRSRRRPYVLGGSRGDPGAMVRSSGRPLKTKKVKEVKTLTSRGLRRQARLAAKQGEEPKPHPQDRSRGSGGKKSREIHQWNYFGDAAYGKKLSDDPRAARK